ncbi:MAG: hypothetical protein O7E57_11100 [Gammaproteobacteria bacterium]|nr:hypothetical protein [Gammaproteobacteria bacterium]
MAEPPHTTPTSISTSPEDATGYRRGAGARRGGGTGGGRMIGVNLILAVLVAGLVIAGWFIANQHQLLGKERRAAAAAEERITSLEERLRATETAMTGSGQDTNEKLIFWEDEIRKVWDIGKRNKNWIKDNESALGKQQKTIQTLETGNRDLKAAVGRHEVAFVQQQAIIDQLTGVELQLQQLIKAQRELVDKVNASRQSVASLQAGLVNRVEDNEQAVAAIDAYRLQLNTRLADIERRLSSLSVNSTL